jgi:2-desacetyl-2-hydroxyethyl bacteriochlorophyllide A dehydrogenase
MNSQAIVFSAPRTVEITNLEISAPASGQVLIRTEHSLISTGTETIVLGGDFEPGSHWDQWVKYPFYPGYCAVGLVEAVGEGVKKYQVGDRIAARTPHTQFALIQENDPRAVLVPDGVSPQDVPWFGMACIAQIGVRRAAHQLGDAVVIIGAGLLGQLVTQYLNLSGAREIIVVDTAPKRLELARSHGATQTLQMGVAEAKAEVWKLTKGLGADVVYDITGHSAVFAHALGLVRNFGKLQLLGDASHPSQQCLTPDVLSRGIQITGAHDNYPPPMASDRDPWSHKAMAQLFFLYLKQKRMRVSDLVSHSFPPADASFAYEMLRYDRATALGVLFNW